MDAIERGFIQQEIQDSAFRLQQEIEANKRIVVGVNAYESPQPPLQGTLKINPELAREQVENLQEIKQTRDQGAVDDALTSLREVAHGDGNTMPAILNAVEAYATLGEISDVLREVFGDYEPSATF